MSDTQFNTGDRVTVWGTSTFPFTGRVTAVNPSDPEHIEVDGVWRCADDAILVLGSAQEQAEEPAPEIVPPGPTATHFWLVWKGEGNAPTRKHRTRAEADNEAERRASLNSGKFYVLETVAYKERPD